MGSRFWSENSVISIITGTTEATNVELSGEMAELLKQFRQCWPQFKILLDAGVFAYYIGSKTIHKNGVDIKQVDTFLIQRY